MDVPPTDPKPTELHLSDKYSATFHTVVKMDRFHNLVSVINAIGTILIMLKVHVSQAYSREVPLIRLSIQNVCQLGDST